MKELAITFVCVFLSSCVDPPILPHEVLANVDRTLTFKMVNASPNTYKGNTIEFGGAIVESKVDGDTIHILVRELPIRTEPVYRSSDTGKSRGLFVVT